MNNLYFINNKTLNSKLSDVASIKKGEQLSKSEMLDNGHYYVLNGGIEPSGFTDKYNTEANTISISEGGNSCGYINYNSECFWSGGHNYTLSIKRKILTKYLYQLLKSKQTEIMNLRVGTGLPNIQKTRLEDFCIKWSEDIDEQEKVSDILSNIDSLIEEKKNELEKTKQYKEAMLYKMFPKEGSKVPEIRFKGFEDEWIIDVLIKFSKSIKDGTHASFKDSKSEYYLLSGKNIKNGTVVYDKKDRTISLDDLESINKSCCLETGDVLLTIVGTIGEVAIVDRCDNICFQRSVAIIKTNNKLNNRYLSYFLQTEFCKKQYEEKKSSSAQAGIYLTELAKVKIMCPKDVEQIKIADFFTSLDNVINNQEKEITILENYKVTLLEKMFA